jgi:very-short-patch-repair endonuclease
MARDLNPTLPSSPFKGDRGGLSKETRGGLQGDKRRSSQWQVADVLDYELLKENARKNRKSPTDAESAFWNLAKASGLGQKCRRQYVVGPYIVDFFFRQSMLIVEIDGGYHLTEEQQLEDSIRQTWLESKGYKVLRFTNEEVLFNPQFVEKMIKDKLSIPPFLSPL